MTNQTALAVVDQQPQPARLVTVDAVPVLDTARFEHMQRIATAMALGSTLPKTLTHEGNSALPAEVVRANCFRIVNQAVRWGMDPFAVIDHASVVHGRLMWEGKLVAAVLHNVAGVRLRHEFFGEPRQKSYGIKLYDAADSTRVVEGTVADWETTGTGSPWGKQGNWQRQLVYRGTREWARIHEPAAMLGIYTDDEFDAPPVDAPAVAATAKPRLTAAFPDQKAETKPKPKTETETEAKPTKPKQDQSGDANNMIQTTEKAETSKAAPSVPPLDEQALVAELAGTFNAGDVITRHLFAESRLIEDDDRIYTVWNYIGNAMMPGEVGLQAGRIGALAWLALSPDEGNAFDRLAAILDSDGFKALPASDRALDKAVGNAIVRGLAQAQTPEVS